MFPDLTRDDVFRLETRRLWLRWPRAADALALAALAKEAAATPGATIPPWGAGGGRSSPRGLLDAAQAYILAARAGNAAGRTLALAVSSRARPGEAIGAMTIASAADGGGTSDGAARLGFWIGAADQGRGLGAEAVEAAASMIFGLTSARVVEVVIEPGGEAARRLLDGFGFMAVGQGVTRMERGAFLMAADARTRRGGAAPMSRQAPAAGDPRATRALAFAAGQ